MKVESVFCERCGLNNNLHSGGGCSTAQAIVHEFDDVPQRMRFEGGDAVPSFCEWDEVRV